MFSCIRKLKLMIFSRQIIYVCFNVHKYIITDILVNRLTITIINKLQLIKSISYTIPTYITLLYLPIKHIGTIARA